MKKAIIILGVLIVITMLGFVFSGNDDAYEQEIKTFWDDREDFLKTSTGSPFIQKNLPYKSISYFDPNKKFRLNATLDRFTKREVLSIGNSDGTTTNYLKFAYANFKIDEKNQRLLILKSLGFGNNYLTAFGDATSGVTTYGGGRYLDLSIGKSDNVIIDFNKAYNPYCAYVADYTCPLPPRENLLEVEIRAGEKQ